MNMLCHVYYCVRFFKNIITLIMIVNTRDV